MTRAEIINIYRGQIREKESQIETIIEMFGEESPAVIQAEYLIQEYHKFIKQVKEME